MESRDTRILSGTVGAGSAGVRSDEAGQDCCVCAEELINDNRTPCCRQRIHKDCLARCLERLDNTCPLCRASVRAECRYDLEPLLNSRASWRFAMASGSWGTRATSSTSQVLRRIRQLQFSARNRELVPRRVLHGLWRSPLDVAMDLGISPPQNSLAAHDAVLARLFRDLEWQCPVVYIKFF